MAALATHYEANTDFTQFRFYLRGNPSPKGIRLPGSSDVPQILKGRKTSPDSSRAYWSDGQPITAHDFVYSWRRFVDPRTAAPLAFQMRILKNAPEVLSGKRPPTELGVYAPDEFTFVVDLRSSMPFFLEFITNHLYVAVPARRGSGPSRNAESTWTEPSHIVTSGPFTLQEHRPYQRIVLARNAHYYDAALVGLDELTFLPVVDGTTVMNLYKTGEAAVTPGSVCRHCFSFPQPQEGLLFDAELWNRSLHQHAQGSVRQRVTALCAEHGHRQEGRGGLYGPDYLPARSLIAPSPGYTQPDSLKVDVDGRSYDVLSFDVEGARSLLAKAGFPGGMTPSGSRLEVPYHFAISQTRGRRRNRPTAVAAQSEYPHEADGAGSQCARWVFLEGDYSG